MRLALAVILSLALAATGCSASADLGSTATTSSPTQAAVPEPTVPPTAASAPPAVEAAAAAADQPLGQVEADAVLSSVGFQVDREVDIWGTDETALVVVISGADAVDSWRTVRGLVDQLGRYPVMSTESAFLFDNAEYNSPDPSGDIAIAATLEPATWFEERISYLGLGPADLEAPGALPGVGWDKDSFLFPTDILSGETLETVDMILLPTTTSWEAISFLSWGGWNDAPADEEVVAVQRYWFENYQAEVISVNSDTIEMIVGSPPRSDEAAKELAREHFVFAPDIVWQGVGDIETLASAVQNASAWYFWWD